MCRAGGRRCPGCHGETARAKHNARRRKNREIRAAVLAWARDPANRIEGQERRHLEALPPAGAKQWARDKGLGTKHLGISLDHTDPGPTPPDLHPQRGGSGVMKIAGPGGGKALGGRRWDGSMSPASFDSDALSIMPGHLRPLSAPALPAPGPGVGAAGGNPRPPTSELKRALAKVLAEAFAAANSPATSSASPAQSGWATPEVLQQVSVTMSRQGRTPVERLLLESTVDGSENVAGGGVNTTRRVDLGNGTFGYHKSFEGLAHGLAHGFGQDSAQQPFHEVAAWRMAEKMGPPWSKLVAPCALRSVDGELGSISLERPGAVGLRPEMIGQDHARAAGFFDALTGAQDRHPGNYVVDTTRGQVTLIDHGFSFRRETDGTNMSVFSDRVRGDRLQARERKVLSEFLGSADAWGLDGLLEADRVAAMKKRAQKMLDRGLICE